MNDQQNNKELQALLKQAIAPVKNTELQRDLWPQFLRRLDEHEKPFRVPWFDWALAAIVAAFLLLFPGAIPALLYHL
jgi:hypothetical protein